MTAIPQPRPHDDDLEHPEWCVPGLCRRTTADIAHEGLPELFIPDHGDGGMMLALARLQDDEIDVDEEQRQHAHEIAISDLTGRLVAVLGRKDAARFAALLLTMSR